tara:strand:+ start:856 stop:1038 length:183 start_codon:yes stop_codon:yes gene_type:complete
MSKKFNKEALEILSSVKLLKIDLINTKENILKGKEKDRSKLKKTQKKHRKKVYKIKSNGR